MPVYEYECTRDGRFEVLARMADSERDARCPLCGAMCERVLSVCAGRVTEREIAPQEQVERAFGGKEEHFTNPFTNRRERLKGTKKEKLAQVRKSIMDTDYARRMNFRESDIDVPNL
jgi:putative FmdB family regulatory protein